ncbi:hypothetical protein IP86_16605, partial [Rhodopseudomonas sp. AAP120]
MNGGRLSDSDFVIASTRIRASRFEHKLREAIQRHTSKMDCFVATLLAMTANTKHSALPLPLAGEGWGEGDAS